MARTNFLRTESLTVADRQQKGHDWRDDGDGLRQVGDFLTFDIEGAGVGHNAELTITGRNSRCLPCVRKLYISRRNHDDRASIATTDKYRWSCELLVPMFHFQALQSSKNSFSRDGSARSEKVIGRDCRNREGCRERDAAEHQKVCRSDSYCFLAQGLRDWSSASRSFSSDNSR